MQSGIPPILYDKDTNCNRYDVFPARRRTTCLASPRAEAHLAASYGIYAGAADSTTVLRSRADAARSGSP